MQSDADTPSAGEAIREEGLPPAGHGSSTDLALPPAEVHSGTGTHSPSEAKATWLGFDATGWVALAMIALIGVMIWKRAFAGLGGALDAKVARIRAELAEAEGLRREAEALLAETRSREAAAAADAEAIRAGARAEAARMLTAAEADAEARIARRTRAAEDRIAAAERKAEDDLRARAAELATEAARRVIMADAGPELHQGLAVRAIEEVGRRL